VSAGNTAAGTAGRGEGQEDGQGREPGSCPPMLAAPA
jgi:hypothetical protein